MKKRIFSLIGILCVLLTLPIHAEAVSEGHISVSEVDVSPGETAEISVAISGNPGMAAWMFEVSWDTSALTLDISDGAAEVGEAFSGGTLLAKQTEQGLNVTWFSIRNVSADGDLFRFRVKANARAGGSYPITVDCSAENTIDAQENPVKVYSGSGRVTVSGTSDPPAEGGGGLDGPDHSNTDETQPTQPEFTDVLSTAYYYNAVQWAVKRGITVGTAKNTFSPEAVCTRGQTVTFLWRAVGSPEPIIANAPFSDVNRGSYYYKAVLWAYENGITNGTSNTTFSPDAIVTRGQMATFLWKAAGAKGAAGQNRFTDVPDNAYYSTAVCWAAERGITTGTSADTFSPENKCTRGQLVTFLHRANIEMEGNV